MSNYFDYSFDTLANLQVSPWDASPLPVLSGESLGKKVEYWNPALEADAGVTTITGNPALGTAPNQILSAKEKDNAPGWLSKTVERLTIVILGFIFVAVGLSMFKQTTIKL